MHQAVTLQASGWGCYLVPPSTPLAHGAVPAPSLSTLRNLSLPATFTPSAPLPLRQRPYNIFISQQGFLFAILTLTGAKRLGDVGQADIGQGDMGRQRLIPLGPGCSSRSRGTGNASNCP